MAQHGCHLVYIKSLSAQPRSSPTASDLQTLTPQQIGRSLPHYHRPLQAEHSCCHRLFIGESRAFALSTMWGGQMLRQKLGDQAANRTCFVLIWSSNERRAAFSRLWQTTQAKPARIGVVAPSSQNLPRRCTCQIETAAQRHSCSGNARISAQSASGRCLVTINVDSDAGTFRVIFFMFRGPSRFCVGSR